MIAQAFQNDGLLTDDQVRQTLTAGLERQFTNQRVLVLIPDHTRTIPLPFLFRELVAILHDTKQLDFMVALGTHPPLEPWHLNQLVGIEGEAAAGDEPYSTRFHNVRILNHRWDLPETLVSIGTLSQDQIQQIAGTAGILLWAAMLIFWSIAPFMTTTTSSFLAQPSPTKWLAFPVGRNISSPAFLAQT